MVKLVIPGVLPNLNDYIAAERRHRQQGAKLKRQAEQKVLLAAGKLDLKALAREVPHEKRIYKPLR